MHEQAQEAEPHHLEREQQRAGQAGRREDPDHGSAPMRALRRPRAQARRAAPPRAPATARTAPRDVAAGRESARAAHAEPLDQHELARERAGDGAERVPAVEASERAAEARIARAQRDDQHRQGRAHRRGRRHQQGEARREPRRGERGVGSEERPQRDGQRRRQLRQPPHQREPAGADRELESGVGDQRTPQPPRAARRKTVPEREARHEARQHDARRRDAVAEGQPRLVEPQRLEDETGGAREEEERADDGHHGRAFR